MQRKFWHGLLLLLIAILLQPVVARAQTNTTSGMVTNAQEWSGTITLTGDITIGVGGAVTVDAGTLVQAAAGDDTGGGLDPSRIEIIVAGGSLTVNGTSYSPVYFTSASTTAAPGDWYGVEFDSGSLTLEQAVIEYGVNGLTVAAGGTNVFANCTITNCSQNGVVVNAPGLHEFQNFQLLDNGQCGLNAPSSTTSVSLNGGSALNNGSHNISCGGQVSATGFQSENAGGWGILAGSVDLSDCDVSENTSGGVSLGLASGTASTANNCTLNDNGGIGLAANYNDTLVLSGCDFMNNVGDGLNEEGYCWSGNLTLTSCDFDGNGGYGVRASGGPCDDEGVVTDCQAVGNGQGGIIFGSGTLVNCTADLNGGAGINLGSGTITGSTASQNNGMGITVGSATVQNCVVTNNLTGVAANNLSLVGCVVVGNVGDGILIQAGNGSVPTFGQGITGNVITNNGVGLQSYWNNTGATFTFTGNNIYGNSQWDAENNGTGTILANDDYWGPFTTAQLESGVACPSRIYDQCDNSAVGEVLIQRYSKSSVVGMPSITLQPVSVTLPPGQTATFSVTAVGAQPLSYQWQFNGFNLANSLTVVGTQTAQLTVSNLAAENVGSYQVVVSNSLGAVTSQAATLTIGYPLPTIALISPANGAAFGAPASITLSATATSLAGIAKVQFYNGVTELGEADKAPYNYTWTGVAAGIYTIFAEATDIYGQTAWSLSSSVIVTNIVPTQRVLRVVATSTAPGANLAVPVQMDALGNENTVAFSLAFNPSLLTLDTVSPGSGLPPGAQLFVNTNNAGSGQIGVLIGLGTGQTLPAAAAQELLVIGFTANSSITSNTNTTIAFADSPVIREIDDANVNILSATYNSGTVQITMGIEGDVWPRPYGDGQLTSADWVQEGRFVAGLSQPLTTNEFERADTAPRSTGGDGRLTAADWVQVGRYVAGLDPITPIGEFDPAELVPAAGVPQDGDLSEQLVVGTFWAEQGSNVAVSVQLIGFGGENGVGFSVSFDATNLVFEGITNAARLPAGMTVVLNTNAAANGQIGVLMALPAGQGFSAGTNTLCCLVFQVAAAAPATLQLTMADSPVVREVASTEAQALNTDFVDGAVNVVVSPSAPTILAPTAQFNGNGFQASFTALPGITYVVETSVDLKNWELLQTTQANAPMMSFSDSTPGLPCRFYRIRAL